MFCGRVVWDAPSRIEIANLELPFTVLPRLGRASFFPGCLRFTLVNADCLQRALHKLNSWRWLASADTDLQLGPRHIGMRQREAHLAALTGLEVNALKAAQAADLLAGAAADVKLHHLIPVARRGVLHHRANLCAARGAPRL